MSSAIEHGGHEAGHLRGLELLSARPRRMRASHACRSRGRPARAARSARRMLRRHAPGPRRRAIGAAGSEPGVRHRMRPSAGAVTACCPCPCRPCPCRRRGRRGWSGLASDRNACRISSSSSSSSVVCPLRASSARRISFSAAGRSTASSTSTRRNRTVAFSSPVSLSTLTRRVSMIPSTARSRLGARPEPSATRAPAMSASPFSWPLGSTAFVLTLGSQASPRGASRAVGRGAAVHGGDGVGLRGQEGERAEPPAVVVGDVHGPLGAPAAPGASAGRTSGIRRAGAARSGGLGRYGSRAGPSVRWGRADPASHAAFRYAATGLRWLKRSWHPQVWHRSTGRAGSTARGSSRRHGPRCSASNRTRRQLAARTSTTPGPCRAAGTPAIPARPRRALQWPRIRLQ